jgi:hypothetical protein
MKDKKSTKRAAPVAGLALVEGKDAAGHEQAAAAANDQPGKKSSGKKAAAKSEKPGKSQPDTVAKEASPPVLESSPDGKKAGHDKPMAKSAKHGKTPHAEKPVKEEKKPLNFKVSSDFRREFKTYASAHDMKLSKLLVLAFESFRKHQDS